MTKFKSKRKERLENRRGKIEDRIRDLGKLVDGLVETQRTLDDSKLIKEVEELLAKYNLRIARLEIKLILVNRRLSREFN